MTEDKLHPPLTDEHVIIETKKGYKLYMDKADLHLLDGKGVGVSRNSRYAVVTEPGKPETALHRLIHPDSPVVDHKNGNGHDNRRCNLRPCTQMQNLWNRRSFRGNEMGLLETKSGTWRARIFANGKNYSKNFATKEEARKWRNEMARELHGEFATILKEDE